MLSSIYDLIPNKTECTYQRMFAAFKTFNPNIQSISGMTDFEIGARNAIISAFPKTGQVGCLFHFGQSLWRKIHIFPIIFSNYKEDPEFACHVKCFQALAFVPVEDVILSFVLLVKRLHMLNSKA
ncbi:hypothetical protein GJ496_009027 [Pomphorhynchus laevis]|nr:hypothetical protein GJ496_009027 [Pomphorhynchus laevis]